MTPRIITAYLSLVGPGPIRRVDYDIYRLTSYVTRDEGGVLRTTRYHDVDYGAFVETAKRLEPLRHTSTPGHEAGEVVSRLPIASAIVVTAQTVPADFDDACEFIEREMAARFKRELRALTLDNPHLIFA